MMRKVKNNKGVALIITILLMFLVFFLAMYFLSFSLTEKRISLGQAWGAKTYYLAEAGIHEMVWKLKNNATYKNNFETNPNWVETFTRNDPFGAGTGSYSVTIRNSDTAHGEIIASSTVNIGGSKMAQRVVKTYVYRAMSDISAVGDNCGYADGNIDLSFSVINFTGGSVYSDNNFTVNGGSTVNIDSDLNVVNNYNESFFSTVNVGGDTYAANMPNGSATPVGMPAVDFDSADPNSYYNRADTIYTSNQFDDLIDDNSTVTLNDPITYVTGDVDLYGPKNLVVNGLLVVERDFEVGRKWCRGWSGCGRSTVTVNHTSGQPSGILAKRKVMFKFWTGQVDIEGVVYASDQMNILSFPFGESFDIDGVALSRKLTTTSVWQPININFNEEIATTTLAITELSPTITVEHWEEEY